MTTIERAARTEAPRSLAAQAETPVADRIDPARAAFTRVDAARGEQARAAHARLRWGLWWVSSLRTGSELSHDIASSVRPEDLARSELFYDSTCCWV